MALNSLSYADVPLSNYRTYSRGRAPVRIALRTEVCVFAKIVAIRSFGHGLQTDCSA